MIGANKLSLPNIIIIVIIMFLLTAVGRLAINDVNKSLLGEAGAIDILVDIASLDDGDQEHVGESMVFVSSNP